LARRQQGVFCQFVSQCVTLIGRQGAIGRA
jgi:hypothetical protein